MRREFHELKRSIHALTMLQVTVTVTAVESASAAVTDAASATLTSSAAIASSTASSTNIGDFGSCSVPQIEFGVGFDGRKETSFEPVDKSTY